MNKAPLIARLIFGFIFFASGIVGLFNLVPPSNDLPENLQTFMAGMMAAKYFFPLLKITEIVCGALILSGYFVSLSLVVLAPITLHIFCTHAFLAPSGLPVASLLVFLQLYLSFFALPYRNPIRALFVKKTTSF